MKMLAAWAGVTHGESERKRAEIEGDFENESRLVCDISIDVWKRERD
jgi:hypothetical protein